ncbi:MAG: hypothetical protein ABI895_07205 [Deltaproteobacteria bacterium]
MTSREKILAYGFMLLSAGHALLGFWYADLPAWKMFRTVPRYRYELRDAQGTAIRAHDYMPKRAYFLTGTQYPAQLAVWLAKEHPERAPIEGRITLITSTETTRKFQVSAGQSSARFLSP